MKKIISMLTVVATIATFSMSAFAAAGDLTLSTNATDNKAVKGDEIIMSATLGSSNGLKSVGLKIAFDLDDFELGVSEASKAAANEYADYIGTPDFPTLDDVTLTLLGRASYVDDTYYSTYSSYAATKKLGDPTIAYEEKDGYGYVTFGYAVATAKNALNKVDNMAVGGVVLVAKTDEAKESVIEIKEATYSGADGVDTPCSSNQIKLALNGYGEVEEADDVWTSDEVSSIPEGKKIVAHSENATVTADSRVSITVDGTTKLFGETISAYLSKKGIDLVGEATANVRFALLVNEAANEITFNVQ